MIRLLRREVKPFFLNQSKSELNRINQNLSELVRINQSLSELKKVVNCEQAWFYHFIDSIQRRGYQ